MSFTHDVEKKRQTFGPFAWARRVKGKYRFLVLDDTRNFPDCMQWVDNPAAATLFPDTVRPHAYFDQLLLLPKRKFMGMIFPAIELAVAFDMDSTAGEVRVAFGASPVYFEPLQENGRIIKLESQIDPDAQN